MIIENKSISIIEMERGPKMSPLISIIVTVYKAELCIGRCIESILSQTFKDYKLILVDDGSPDKSGEICDSYAQKDERIHVIHQENKGASGAYNAGINYALTSSESKYLSFVDGDDTIDNDYFEKLLLAIQEKDADIVLCGCRNIDTETDKLLFTDSPMNHKIELHNGNCIVFWGVQWGKLIKASLIKDKCFFTEGVQFEDDPYSIMVHSLADRVIPIDYIGYNYYVNNPNSIIGIEAKEHKYIEKFPYAAYEDAVKTVIEFGDDLKFNHLQVYYLSNMMGVLFKKIKRKEARSIVEFHYRLCREYTLTKRIEHIHLPLKNKLKISFMIFATKMRLI